MEKTVEPEICKSFLQWGNRKRPRCTKVNVGRKSEDNCSFPRKPAIRVDRRVVRAEKEILLAAVEDHKSLLPKAGGAVINKKTIGSSLLPERKERPQHRQHAENGLIAGLLPSIHADEEMNNKTASNDSEDKPEAIVWPKFLMTLSRAEKEHDFLAMKGTKLPLRPKKRAKQIQRAILSVSPGGWLSELSQDRYEVKEKKCIKKRPRGLKGMRSMETDSE
eukprot:TRINITY_DN13543_c0_g1_i2.p1 TRINITY_DN13543_c0_g1~~TRINITY_DN13543_c0_g1_i2.p1  ORF type:complete len:220 (-),score=29.63 TRINITY_DN13543_c0_g1_i2:288-947(-)